MPQPGVDLIEIILTMNCYNAFTLLWKKRIQTLWLAKPKNSSWDLLKSWKLAQRKLPLLILLKSLKCMCIQVFSWNQFHENFRKNGSQFTSVKLYLFIFWRIFRLHRQPKHLLAFLFAELGTTGALDGSNQLVMKGKFQQKHIENVLRRYIKEYVTCKS